MDTGIFAIESADERTVKGLLLPWGEESRMSASNTAPIRFAKDSIPLPRDASVVTLNVEHDRFEPIGRATALESTEEGIVATFRIADTDEGDAYLAAPEKRRLSAELAGIVRQGVEGVKARLTGAALVTEGAFASAGLFALGEITEEEADAAQQLSEQAEEQNTDPAEEASASDATDADTSAEQEDAMAEAIAPVTAVEAETIKAEELGANAVFAAITAASNGDKDAEQMLAALADIKHTGAGALPAAGVLQPAWVGEVWSGRAYQRKYLPLGTTGTIAAMDAKGFRLNQGTALVQAWGGNKTELPTGTATTEVIGSILKKYGYAADIAREFFDLPGGEAVIAAFTRGVVESYARVTDADALAAIVTAAGAPVAAGTFPTEYPSALGQLIQGMKTLEDRGDTATFAIMNDAAYTEALFAAKDKMPEFINFDFGVNAEGTANGFQVVRGDIGIDDTPAVLVGSKAGIRFNELGSTPIQVDALDLARGGVDRAVVGYLQILVEREDSFVLIGSADTV